MVVAPSNKILSALNPIPTIGLHLHRTYMKQVLDDFRAKSYPLERKTNDKKTKKKTPGP